MTFTPLVLTDTDVQNSVSTTSSSFTGSICATTGYNTIVLVVEATASSTAGGIIIEFSDTKLVGDLQTFYVDTYLVGKYMKSFKVLKKYFRVRYTSSTLAVFTITTRLSTDFDTTFSNGVYYMTDDGSMDAFGKLRVSNPYTLLDLKFPGQSIASGASPEFLNNNVLETNTSSGSFSAVYQNAKSIMTGTGVGYFINQSRKNAIYQPGKSMLVLLSGIIYSGPTGTAGLDYVSRVGYFDSNNGVFFAFDSQNGISVNVRNNASDTVIYRSEWNIDKMDGDGPSSLSLDFTKGQLFVIDFEWLSVGRVRYGFYAFGKIYYCHQIPYLNILGEPYMQTANLPLRYELQGYNALQVTPASLVEICATAISEGGYTPIGRPFSTGNNTTGISLPNTDETFTLAIRINPTYQNSGLVPTGLSIIGDNQNIVLYRARLYLSVSPGSLSFTNVNTNSIAQVATTFSSGGLSTTGSIVIDEGYFAGKQTTAFSSLSNVFTNLLQLSKDVTGVSDVLVITCQKISGGSTTVYANINWQELY